jgi:hypothetical protein
LVPSLASVEENKYNVLIVINRLMTHNIYYYSQLTHLTISFSDAACTFILLYMCSILSDLEINHVHLYYYIFQRHKDCWGFFMAIFYQGHRLIHNPSRFVFKSIHQPQVTVYMYLTFYWPCSMCALYKNRHTRTWIKIQVIINSWERKITPM